MQNGPHRATWNKSFQCSMTVRMKYLRPCFCQTKQNETKNENECVAVFWGFVEPESRSLYSKKAKGQSNDEQNKQILAVSKNWSTISSIELKKILSERDTNQIIESYWFSGWFQTWKNLSARSKMVGLKCLEAFLIF